MNVEEVIYINFHAICRESTLQKEKYPKYEKFAFKCTTLIYILLEEKKAKGMFFRSLSIEHSICLPFFPEKELKILRRDATLINS